MYPTERGFDRVVNPTEENGYFTTGEQANMWLDRPVRSFTHALSYIGPDGPRQARG
ncbi:MAG: hypothetical protein PUC00_07035 [Clostridiales bacterium]|nr:hypothetical protein [Clostridiales bacterium]